MKNKEKQEIKKNLDELVSVGECLQELKDVRSQVKVYHPANAKVYHPTAGLLNG